MRDNEWLAVRIELRIERLEAGRNVEEQQGALYK